MRSLLRSWGVLPGWSLLCFIARDIAGRHTRSRKCWKGSSRRRASANGKQASPPVLLKPFVFVRTVSVAFQRRRKSRRDDLNSGGSDMTNGDFWKELAKAGLGWLPVKVGRSLWARFCTFTQIQNSADMFSFQRIGCISFYQRWRGSDQERSCRTQQVCPACRFRGFRQACFRQARNCRVSLHQTPNSR